MKPSGINPTGGIGSGHSPGILRAVVLNIRPGPVIIVKLLVASPEAYVRSIGSLFGKFPSQIKIGDIVDVRSRQGYFEFVRMAEKAADQTPVKPASQPDDAVPQVLETEKTELPLSTRTGLTVSSRPSNIAIEPSAANKAFPHLLENTAELLGEGKRLNRLLLQQPSAEIRSKAESWIVQAKEMIAYFRSETMRGWTSNLVRIRGDIIDIANFISKLTKRMGRIAPIFVIPVPENISLDITEKVAEPASPAPQSKPIEPSAKDIRSVETKKEDQKPGNCSFVGWAIVQCFIFVSDLVKSNRWRTLKIEQVRQLHEHVDKMVRGYNFELACQEEEKLGGKIPNRALYRQIFEEFAVKFGHYLNTKGLDPEKLIDNPFRTMSLDFLAQACRYFDRDHLERGGLDVSEREKVESLKIWLNFILSGNNLILEYKGLNNRTEEQEKHKITFRKALVVIDKYYKAG